MPRPRKSANDQRPHRFTVRLSAAGQEAFQARVEEAAVSPSDYARRMLTRGRVELVQAHPALPLRAIMELNRIGVNLNQLTRTANATGRLPAGERVAWTYTENLRTDQPRRAWREMAWTAGQAEALKRKTGQKSTGRKADKPVYHLSLSWGWRGTRPLSCATPTSRSRTSIS